MTAATRTRQPKITVEQLLADHDHEPEATGTMTIEEVMERWHEFCAGMRTEDGYRYSPRNLNLIFNQSFGMAVPTRLRAYRGWLQEGRQVRKGEHAIYVLVPREISNGDDDDPVNPDGSRKVRGFHLTALFDISQTDPETETT